MAQPTDDQLLDAFAQQIDRAQALYLLVDPLAGEPTPVAGGIDAQALSAQALQAQRESAWQRPVYPIALDPATDLVPAAHPYLVSLDPRNDMWLAESCAIAIREHRQCRKTEGDEPGNAPHRIGGWLQSGRDPQQLAQTLALAMRLKVAVPTRAKYLRLADRRVLALMRVVVGDAALSDALNLVERWIYLDPLGQWATLTGSGNEPAGSLRLDAQQWATLSLGHRIHPALAQWLAERDKANLPSPSPSAHEALARAIKAVHAAQQSARGWPLCFEGEADHIAWAVLHLLHAKPSEHEDVAALLREFPQDDEPARPLRALRPSIDRLLQDIEQKRLHNLLQKSRDT